MYLKIVRIGKVLCDKYNFAFLQRFDANILIIKINKNELEDVIRALYIACKDSKFGIMSEYVDLSRLSKGCLKYNKISM